LASGVWKQENQETVDGDAELIEASPYDHFWDCGASGTGLSMLGAILMATRAAPRKGSSKRS